MKVRDLPSFMYHRNEKYSMELLNTGFYQTTMPNSIVGKIGASYPPKKKYNYDELIKNGWKDKHYDCNVCRTKPCSCKYGRE